MKSTTDRARRFGAVLVMTVVASAGLVLLGDPVDAHHCSKPTETGNFTANVGGVGTVGIDQNNIGSTEHDVIVCADPPHQQTTVDVRDDDPPATGAQVGVGTCGALGCHGVGYTGVEASWTTLFVDQPLDRNNTVGVSSNKGSGICPWVNGSKLCQGGGWTTVSTPGGEAPPPPPVHPFVTHMYYESLYGVPNYGDWCLDMVFAYNVQWGAGLCTTMVANRLVWGPLGALGIL